VQALETRLQEIVGPVCQEHQAEVEEREVLPDQVQRHGECRSTVWHPSAGESDERRTSRLRRQEFPALKRKLPTLWTNSYCVGTTGGAQLRTIKQYIEQQKHVEAREAHNGQQADKNVSVPALSNA
jgi:REP-associated tyrosine transposase